MQTYIHIIIILAELKKIQGKLSTQFDQRGSIQSCSAGAENFTNYVFCHPQFSAWCYPKY